MLISRVRESVRKLVSLINLFTLGFPVEICHLAGYDTFQNNFLQKLAKYLREILRLILMNISPGIF